MDKKQSTEQEVLYRRLQKESFTPREAFSLSACLDEYHRTFILLRQYDEGDTSSNADDRKADYPLEINKANLIIKELKRYLAENGESVQNFGVARSDDVGKVLMNIYQTWDGKELYPDLEGKAAHLFYFLIKDHLFIDGNKRIAALMLLWFMDMNDMLLMGRDDRTLSYNIVYALAVFVAESSPKDKQIVVRLIHNIIMSHNKALPE